MYCWRSQYTQASQSTRQSITVHSCQYKMHQTCWCIQVVDRPKQAPPQKKVQPYVMSCTVNIEACTRNTFIITIGTRVLYNSCNRLEPNLCLSSDCIIYMTPNKFSTFTTPIQIILQLRCIWYFSCRRLDTVQWSQCTHLYYGLNTLVCRQE